MFDALVFHIVQATALPFYCRALLLHLTATPYHYTLPLHLTLAACCLWWRLWVVEVVGGGGCGRWRLWAVEAVAMKMQSVLLHHRSYV